MDCHCDLKKKKNSDSHISVSVVVDGGGGRKKANNKKECPETISRADVELYSRYYITSPSAPQSLEARAPGQNITAGGRESSVHGK